MTVPIPLSSPACQNNTKHKFLHPRLSGRQRQIFASPLVTATPNDIYTQQVTSTACQDDAKHQFSHLRLSRLPHEISSSSRPYVLRLPYERQPRASRRSRAQQLLQKALHNAPATRKPAGGHAGQPATTRAAAPPNGAVYCACHTKASRGPAAPTRAATSPGGSMYCACHTTTWCD